MQCWVHPHALCLASLLPVHESDGTPAGDEAKRHGVLELCCLPSVSRLVAICGDGSVVVSVGVAIRGDGSAMVSAGVAFYGDGSVVVSAGVALGGRNMSGKR
eukprot:scaffold59675_cov18-Tisochrysis_lutea.AAC.1